MDYGGIVTDREDLILPHPRMHERALFPLLRDVVLDWVHPITRSGIATLIEALPDDQMLRGGVVRWAILTDLRTAANPPCQFC